MSYPYLSDLIKSITGTDTPLHMPMFGLCVALAMIVASTLLSRELSRMYAAGDIPSASISNTGSDGQKYRLEVPPQDVVPDLTFIVMLAGILGARLFHILEHLDAFSVDPIAMLLSTSGLSIFGGLIFGTCSGIFCVRKWRLPFRSLLDAAAPSMMIGYAIGRVGCQISGDGDWGIMANAEAKPSWLPTWLWSQTYDHNIYGEVIANPGVYPTPIYETAMALFCFFILWKLRKNPFQAGWLFSVYLIFAGIERFMIEQIRVNPVFKCSGILMTQAEIISVTLFLIGIAGITICSERVTKKVLH